MANGWLVEVWAWSSSISGVYRAMAREQGRGKMTVNILDNHGYELQ